MEAFKSPTGTHGYSLLYCYGYPLKKSKGDILTPIYSSIGLPLWPGIFSVPSICSHILYLYSSAVLEVCTEHMPTQPRIILRDIDGDLCKHVCHQSQISLTSIDSEELWQSTVHANTQRRPP